MNISTDFTNLSPNFKKKPDGYEWWYTDGLSADGTYGFVIIFYHENPFSTQKIKELDKGQILENDFGHPAISVSVYKNSETIYYSFLEYGKDDFSWDKENKRLRVGADKLVYHEDGEEVKLEIRLGQKLASGYGLKGKIEAKSVRPPADLIKEKSSENHAWNLLLPALQFEADLEVDGKQGREKVEFSGTGYHDHNTGSEPMKDSFKDWYWGRYHFGEYSLVYYLMNRHHDQQFEAWLLDAKNQTVLTYFDEAKLEYFGSNWFGLGSARKITLKSGEVSVNIQCKDKIDDGPFYQRFFGNSVLRYNGQVYGAQGISEYIYPKNIYKRMFWPLVHMRLRHMNEEPHWVQKSPRMYPWTW